ncbi:DNA cytosine methyltransferase [Sphingomonas sp. MS122]|uniref:DNA cytosine methyltransferase n=1 Tax=Sphingomonas sp. MS122 TaxID=3412683 RepID=UPI003C2E1965
MRAEGLFIDGFAGGGGASTGIAQAIGRDVDIAINHNPTAIAIHKANHPTTEHHCTDIRLPFLPRNATRGQKVAGAWFSPDCKEYSKAKGGPVKDRSIRALCWEVVWWLDETRPAVAYLENVEEFEYAAPLDGNGVPLPDQKGREFKKFVRQIRRLGYRVDWKCLRACDYGAPTSRKRLYMVMRRDKQPIVWPKASHAPANDNRVMRGELLPYRTAAECIDWTIHCPSIFDRDRELAEATKRRIAHGVMRYVVLAQRPFIVPLTHQGSVRVHDIEDPFRTITGAHRGELAASDVTLAPFVSYGQHGGANRPANDPLHTVAASKKDTNGIVAATLVQTGYGERPGQAPRVPHLDKPLGTNVAGACKHAAVTAFLSSFYGSDKAASGGDPEQPLRTARASGQHHAVVAAHIEQANTGMVGHTPRKPLSTIVGKGCTQRIVETTLIEEGALPPDMMARAVRTAAFLIKYYGTDGESEIAQIQPVDRPIDTVTTKARFAVVTVTIDAVTYVIVDIGLRMLKPRELARAQGFPDDYILDPVVRKFLRGKWVERRLTIAEQISAIGNSVCPPVARALVAANQPGIDERRLAA